MARQRLDPLYRSYRRSPSIRPNANPRDTYEKDFAQTGEAENLSRLAKSLSGFNENLTAFFADKKEEMSEAEMAKAKADYQKYKMSWKELSKNHEVAKTVNPFYKKGWRLAHLTNIGQKIKTETLAQLATQGPPEDYDTWFSETTNNMIKEMVPEGADPLEMEQTLYPLIAQTKQRADEMYLQKSVEYQNKQKVNTLTDSVNQIFSEFDNEYDFTVNRDTVSELLQNRLDYMIEETGMDPILANETLVKAVAREAEANKNPEMLNALYSIKTNRNRNLATSTNKYGEIIEKTKDAIEDAEIREMRNEDYMEKRQLEETTDKITSGILKAVMDYGAGSSQVQTLLRKLIEVNPDKAYTYWNFVQSELKRASSGSGGGGAVETNEMKFNDWETKTRWFRYDNPAEELIKLRNKGLISSSDFRAGMRLVEEVKKVDIETRENLVSIIDDQMGELDATVDTMSPSGKSIDSNAYFKAKMDIEEKIMDRVQPEVIEKLKAESLVGKHFIRRSVKEEFRDMLDSGYIESTIKKYEDEEDKNNEVSGWKEEQNEARERAVTDRLIPDSNVLNPSSNSPNFFGFSLMGNTPMQYDDYLSTDEIVNMTNDKIINVGEDESLLGTENEVLDNIDQYVNNNSGPLEDIFKALMIEDRTRRLEILTSHLETYYHPRIVEEGMDIINKGGVNR